MINNNNNETILDSIVAKAISVANRNPFDKQICTNCKQCAAKGDIKFYCGSWRKSVNANGSCENFSTKIK